MLITNPSRVAALCESKLALNDKGEIVKRDEVPQGHEMYFTSQNKLSRSQLVAGMKLIHEQVLTTDEAAHEGLVMWLRKIRK